MKPKSHILICDPNPESEKNLTEILIANNYEVTKALDGHEVLDKIKSLDYDLAVIASDTLAMDGFQVCRLLKEGERTRHIPVMIASGHSDKVTRNRAIQSGADEFITKPYNRVELLSRVVTLLRIKSLHDRLERLIEEKEDEKRKLAIRTSELKLLSDIARTVISIKDQKSVLSEIINNVRESFQVEAALIVTRSAEQWILETISTNISQDHVGKPLVTGSGIYDYIVHTEKPLILNEAASDERIPKELRSWIRQDVHTMLASPIFIRGQLIAILQILNKKNQAAFEMSDLSLLMTVSGQLALALENMQLFNRLSDFNKNLQDQINKAIQAIVELKNFNESILQNVSSGLITVDFAGRILFVNRACKAILGYPELELIDRTMEDVFGREATMNIMRPTLDSEGIPINAETQVQTKDRKNIYLGYTTTVRYDSEHTMAGYIISFRDITQIKEMHETILRMDRLASSGVLTSAIAHEIRNPLAGIKTMAQTLEKELPAGDTRQEYVHRIIKQINRLNDLLKAFFTYAKPVRPEKRVVELRTIVAEVKALLKERCENDRIEIEEFYDPFVPPLHVDENQFEQVLLNLMMNALDAIGQNGKVKIHAVMVSKPAAGLEEERDWIEIRISDTGKGIPEEHRRSIFDPFFTTKPNGIGLGLSIVYRIMHEHGGEITVQSREQKGTTFILLLPVTDPAVPLLTEAETAIRN